MANKDSIDPGLRFSKIEDFAESLNQWRLKKNSLCTLICCITFKT